MFFIYLLSLQTYHLRRTYFCIFFCESIPAAGLLNMLAVRSFAPARRQCLRTAARSWAPTSIQVSAFYQFLRLYLWIVLTDNSFPSLDANTRPISQRRTKLPSSTDKRARMYGYSSSRSWEWAMIAIYNLAMDSIELVEEVYDRYIGWHVFRGYILSV